MSVLEADKDVSERSAPSKEIPTTRTEIFARLTPIQARTVQLLETNPGMSRSQLAEALGVSEGLATGLRYSKKVRQARELLDACALSVVERHYVERFDDMLDLATMGLVSILQDESLSGAVRLRAIENVLDRHPTAGFQRRKAKPLRDGRKIADTTYIEELKRSSRRLVQDGDYTWLGDDGGDVGVLPGGGGEGDG